MTWQLRMAHEKAWRDAAVESGCCTPPTQPDPPGGLALAGPVMKLCPALYEAFLKRGHTSLSFNECQCHRASPPNASAGIRPDIQPQTPVQRHPSP